MIFQYRKMFEGFGANKTWRCALSPWFHMRKFNMPVSGPSCSKYFSTNTTCTLTIYSLDNVWINELCKKNINPCFNCKFSLLYFKGFNVKKCKQNLLKMCQLKVENTNTISIQYDRIQISNKFKGIGIIQNPSVLNIVVFIDMTK